MWTAIRDKLIQRYETRDLQERYIVNIAYIHRTTLQEVCTQCLLYELYCIVFSHLSKALVLETVVPISELCINRKRSRIRGTLVANSGCNAC